MFKKIDKMPLDSINCVILETNNIYYIAKDTNIHEAINYLINVYNDFYCTLICTDSNKEVEVIELKYNCFQNKIKKSFKLGNTI